MSHTLSEETLYRGKILKYLVGELLYGGHISDFWDSRVCRVLLEDLFDGSPVLDLPKADLPYDSVATWISQALNDSPTLLGLHHNAEIDYLHGTQDYVFKSILALDGINNVSIWNEGSDNELRFFINEFLTRLPPHFKITEIEERAKPLLSGAKGPYVSFAVRECLRMNCLLDVLRDTLASAQKCLDGTMNISLQMEGLINNLSNKIVYVVEKACIFFAKAALFVV